MKLNEMLAFLTQESARFKVAYGGRGGGKSWDFAASLLLIGKQKKVRIVCCRENQNSIAESVHHLLHDLILKNEMDDFYTITEAKITGANGTEILFKGLKNPGSLKSLEGADYVWIEEAQTLKERTFAIVEPTIRKEGSEIWFSFNPDFATDFVYDYFITNTPANTIVCKINYLDNPFCTQVMIESAERLKAKDIDAYNHVYLGYCVQVLEGAVYAKELRAATTENRILNVPVVPNVPVHTFWDLGYADFTSVWFVQYVGLDTRIVDYHQGQFEAMEYYFKMLREKDYYYGFDYLPHDANHRNLSNGGNSIKQQFKTAGRKVKMIPIDTIANGIFSVRRMFPSCVFDEKRCSEGLMALRRYKYGINTATGQYTKEPLHDEYSHAADAFRYVASAHKADKHIANSYEAIANHSFNQQQQHNRPSTAIGAGEVTFI